MNQEIQKYKYGRTYHLPWTAHKTTDDKIWDEGELLKAFSGKEIIITEKMDGECFHGNTKISMATGKALQISTIVNDSLTNEYVLGVNEEGKIVPSRIISVFANGDGKDWLEVQVKGSHGPYTKLICTPNHLFYVPNYGWIEAGKLQPNNKILLNTFSEGLTENQKQILLGKLLGDGSLHILPETGTPNRESAIIQFSHKEEHKEYISWTKKCLGSIGCEQSSTYTSGFESKMIKSWTKASHQIYEDFLSFIIDGRKTVPDFVADRLTPLAIAFWYMDDGSLVHSEKQQDRMQFATCAFSEAECAILQKGLQRFGIETTYHNYEGYSYISVNAENSRILSRLIREFVPSVMQYKLLKCDRNIKPTELHEIAAPFYWARESVVISVKPYVSDKLLKKYDIETETHNYFANGVLVHNCTTIYNDGSFHARSIDGRHHPSRNRMVGIAKGIGTKLPRGWRVCGENVYAQHSIAYTNLPDYFMVFGIYDENNFCLDWDDTEYFAEELGLTLVPKIWRGNWDHFYVNYPDMTRFIMSNGWLSEGEYGHIGEREGYVVRTVEGFHFDDLGSHCGKYVRFGHVQTDEHWMHKAVVPNGLKE